MIQLRQQRTLLAAVAETIVREQEEQRRGSRDDYTEQQQAVVQHFRGQHLHKVVQGNGGMTVGIRRTRAVTLREGIFYRNIYIYV